VEELIPIFLFIVIGGVMIMRPVTKKLGLLIEALAKERMGRARNGAHDLDEAQLIRITAALERLNNRMDHIDDRIGFVERLVEDRPRTRSRLTG
jgi:hypothetical protein